MSETINMSLSNAPSAEPRPSLWASWRDDLNCVFARDPAARNLLEVLTTYPGVHAILLHRLSHRLWATGWRYPARLIAFISRWMTNVDIHPGARIGQRFFIDHGAGVVIGETAEVGDDVTLYHGVTLGGTTWNPGKRHPTLGNGIVIGAGAKILGPITLGDHVRVGANSVVVKDVPPERTVVGIPGRMVAHRTVARPGKHGISLDHHLLPDPVAKSISCLLERIEVLEKQLASQTSHDEPAGDAASCHQCSAGDLCCELSSDSPDVSEHSLHSTPQL